MAEEITNTLGESLRAARKAKKLTLEKVNLETKISVEALKSLEQDDFESFESDIYLKGFLRNYARFLGMDVEQALRGLRKQRGGGSSATGAVWDTEGSVKEEKLKSPWLFKRVFLPLLLVIILVLTILYFNERQKVKRLTPGGSVGYLTTEWVSSRLS